MHLCIGAKFLFSFFVLFISWLAHFSLGQLKFQAFQHVSTCFRAIKKKTTNNDNRGSFSFNTHSKFFRDERRRRSAAFVIAVCNNKIKLQFTFSYCCCCCCYICVRREWLFVLAGYSTIRSLPLSLLAWLNADDYRSYSATMANVSRYVAHFVRE